MKNLKLKAIILTLCLVTLNSCIIKSLQPFYTTESLTFQKAFIGEWEDQKKGVWNVISFKEAFEKENKISINKTTDNANFIFSTKLSKEELETYKKYKKGYFVEYVKNEKKAVFIAMPFKIGNQTLIDFIPFDYDDDDTNSLVSQHLLKTHSVAKLDILKDKQIKITWLDEDIFTNLYENNQMQLKHETIGADKSLVLTASSEELYQFLEKFLKSDIENKWKSDNEFTLKQINAKPSIKL